MSNFSERDTIVFKPLEAKLNAAKDSQKGKIDAYCRVRIGLRGGKTSETGYKGTNPTWSDAISIERKQGDRLARLTVKDKDKPMIIDKVGKALVDIEEVKAKGKVTRWYDLYKHNKMTGTILLCVEYVEPTLDFSEKILA